MNRKFDFAIAPFEVGDGVGFGIAQDGAETVVLAIRPMNAGVHSYRIADGKAACTVDVYRPWVRKQIFLNITDYTDAVRHAAWYAAKAWPVGWFTTSEAYDTETMKPIKPEWAN
jgi:hypothetical protein